MLKELCEKYPHASDFVIRRGEVYVISSKMVVGREVISEEVYKELVVRLVRDGELDVDTSYEEGGYRFRVNVSTYDGGKEKEITLRWLRDVSISLPERFIHVGLQNVAERIRKKKGGIMLVIGPTGSGKSTFMAGVLNSLLESEPIRVITLEDPVEYYLKAGRGIVLQREVGVDVESFARGLKSALRQNPNVIFVGEVRDEETVELLLQAGDTGHVVFATLHTDKAGDTLERLLGLLPVAKHEIALKQLAKNLIGIVGVRLFDIDGRKVSIYEYLNISNDPAVQSVIARRDFANMGVYTSNLERGHIPFELSVADLVKSGVISREHIGLLPVKQELVLRYVNAR